MIEQSILLHVQQSIYYTSSCGQSICNLNLMPHPIILATRTTRRIRRFLLLGKTMKICSERNIQNVVKCSKKDWWKWLKLYKIVQILQSTSRVGKGAVTPLSEGSQSSHAQDVVSIQFPIGFIFDIVSRVLQCSAPRCSLLRGDWMAPILFCGGEYKSWSGGAEINSFHRPLHPVKQKPLNSKWKKIHREWIWLW